MSAPETVYYRFLLRGKTAAEWTASSASDILYDREMGIETDTGKRKLGRDGLPWNDLEYLESDGEIVVHFDGGGGNLTVGAYLDLVVPRDMHLNDWTAFIDDASGSIEVDIYNCDYASYPPDDTMAITNGDLITVSAALKGTSTVVWDGPVLAESIIRIIITARTGSVTKASINIGVTKV